MFLINVCSGGMNYRTGKRYRDTGHRVRRGGKEKAGRLAGFFHLKYYFLCPGIFVSVAELRSLYNEHIFQDRIGIGV
jgi:hypothetical protein